MSDEQTGQTEYAVEESSQPVASAGIGDEELRNFGAGIALCAILILFVSSSFAIWNVELKSDAGDFSVSGDYTFDVNEFEIDMEGMDNTVEYDDSDCDCSDLESFFGNLKILLYIVLIAGAFMVYMGHTGEKMEFAEKSIAAVALISLIIVGYTFVGLPSAFNEDMELDDVEAKFIGTDSVTEDGVELELKGSPGLGFIASVVPLGLSGYLIKNRGITLEDITG